jgi:phosphohistidine swiveling domain-containing protein
MTPERIKQIVLKDKWTEWMKRPFYAFMMSTFWAGNSKKSFSDIGLPGWELDSFIFNESAWYKANEPFDKAVPAAAQWLRTHSIAEITDSLERFYQEKVREFKVLAKNPQEDIQGKLKAFAEFMRLNCAYVWGTHILEHYLLPKLRQETAKYIKKDLEKFIGDASYPEKKNELEKMDEEIMNGADYSYLAKKYGWLRARDGFARPYTASEIAQHAREVKRKKEIHKRPAIPAPLTRLYEQARELVFYRTQRTDVYYEITFIARPILKAAAKKYHIPFSELRYYTLQSLIAGKPKKYPKDFSCIGYKGEMAFYPWPIIKEETNFSTKELSGTVAQLGFAKGKAKVVMRVEELKKVKKGDILITYMTSPNFLPAMKLAAGFVTNEGGLTCHAAIVAREMGRPCIIGAKNATKIFKDGDMVEVDANKGIVRLVKTESRQVRKIK